MRVPFFSRLTRRPAIKDKKMTRSERKELIKKDKAERFKRSIHGLLPKPWRGARDWEDKTPTRQARRRQAFIVAFNGVSEKYWGEPRKYRRRMARSIAKRAMQKAG